MPGFALRVRTCRSDNGPIRGAATLDTQNGLGQYFAKFVYTNPEEIDHGATLTSLPVVVLFVMFQSRISAGLTSGAVKG